MTPGQARGLLLGFAALLTGVTLNAICLQQRAPGTAEFAPERVPRPAPRPRISSGQDAPPLHIARFAPEPTPATASARASAAGDADTVRAIQVELAARGLGPVPSDGSDGLATRAAIMAYEHDHGLPLTATPSEQLLHRLLFGGAEGNSQAAPGVTTAAAAEVVGAVQRALAELGYLNARADGRLTPETVRAMRKFERDRGLLPKGRISAELVQRLGAAAGKAVPR